LYGYYSFRVIGINKYGFDCSQAVTIRGYGNDCLQANIIRRNSFDCLETNTWYLLYALIAFEQNKHVNTALTALKIR